MSEKPPSEQAPSLEEVPDVAAQYLEAIDEEPEHQEQLHKIDAELDKLKSEREEVVEDVGEDHYLVEDIDADIQKLEEDRGEHQKSTKDTAQLQEHLLRAAAEKPGFRLNEQWLTSKTLRALTHSLYGTREENLVIADQELCTPDDAQQLDRVQKIQIKREIVHLARDQLAGDERVAERWEEFEDSPAHKAFSVIARDPGVAPSVIAEEYDEKTHSTVRDWTSSLSDQEDLKMVYTPKQGEYHLSTVGKCYAAHYADLDGVDDTEGAEDEDEDTGQVGLGNSNKTPEVQPRGSADAEQSVNLSEVETTEEKAEALFNEVSETRRSNE